MKSISTCSLNRFASAGHSIKAVSVYAAAAVALLLSPVAWAHHPMGGQLPTGVLDGLLSGIGHPVIGLDHLAFIVATGLLLAVSGLTALARLSVVVAFVAGTALGTALHLALVSLPAGELIIAFSVLLAGLCLVVGLAMSTLSMVLLCSLAGLFHGYAYGESVVGAQSTALVAYIAGFALIQAAIITAVQWLATRFSGPSTGTRQPVAAMLSGGVLALFGAVLLVQQL